MITISNRGKNAPSSPIRKLEPFARQAIEKNKTIFHLNIGQPDIPTPAEFLQHARMNQGEILSYSPSVGMYEFRKSWVSYYNKLGLSIDENDVLVTTGGSEALLFTIMALCNPDDEIITPEPYYPNYTTFAMMAGAKIRPLTCKIEDGFALPPIEDFERSLTPKTKAILLCNPSNPTGAVYTQQALKKLVELCQKRGIALISDEVYREFVYSQEPHSILSIPGAFEVAIVIDSLSKRFSACGARIGALVTKIKDVLSAATRFAMSRLSPPSLGQLGGIAVLSDPAPFVNPMIEQFKKRQQVLSWGLQNIKGVLSNQPQGAFYVMAKLPVQSSEHFCQWLLTDFSYDNETVMLAPGPGFYGHDNLGLDEVRIAYVLDEHKLTRALELLKEALNSYNR